MKTWTKENLYEELTKWVDNKQGYLTESTANLLRFRTVSGGKTDLEKAQFQKSIKECFKYLSELSEKIGLNFVNLDDKVSYIEQPEGDKVVAIPAHIDVVPAGEGWRYPAFGGIIARGKVWGRGAQDDKGPLMACLFGLYGLKELGVKFHTKIHLVIGTQEEVGDWSDIQYYISKEGSPAFGFTPDGTFPIINGEKGIMNLNIHLDCDLTHRSDDSIDFFELSGGDRANIVPDLADLSLLLPSKNPESALIELEKEVREFLANNSNSKIDFPLEIIKQDEQSGRKIVTIHFRGEPAHGSKPWDGHNAISDSLNFISRLKNIPKEIKTFAEFIYRSTLDHNGKSLNIYVFHDFIGPTVINLGIVRLSLKGGHVVINIRPPLGLTCSEVKEKIESVIRPVVAGSGVKIYQKHEGKGIEALYVDPQKYSFYFNAMTTAYQTVTKMPAELNSIGGTTFAKACPNTVCFGPVIVHGEEKELCHMKDECVTINELIRNTKIYGYTLGLMAAELEK